MFKGSNSRSSFFGLAESADVKPVSKAKHLKLCVFGGAAAFNAS